MYLLFFCLLFQADEPIDLALLQYYVVNNNSALHAHHMGLSQAFGKANAALYLDDPKVSISTFAQEVETRVGPQRFRLDISQSVPWPGLRKARYDAFAAEGLAHLQRHREGEADLEREVARMWYERFFLQQKLLITRENLNLMTQMESVARARFRTNQSSYAFVVQAQAQLADLTEQIQGVQDEVQAIEARMRGIAGLDDSRPFAVVELGEPRLPENLKAQPMFARLDAEQHASKQRQEVVRYGYKPSFTAGLSYIYTDPARTVDVPGSGKDPLIATIGFNVPLFRGRTRAQIGVERAVEEAVNLRRIQAKHDLRADYEATHSLLRKATRRYELYRDTLIPKSRDALDAALKAFRTGELGFSEVVYAQRDLLGYQLTMQRALTDAHLHLAELSWLGDPNAFGGAQ